MVKQTSCIPESNTVRLLVDNRVDGIVIKNCWHILAREFIVDVANQEAGLSNCTIANNDNFHLI